MGSDDEWAEPEMHPLWEYPSYPCSDVHTLMTFDLTSPVPSALMRMSGTMELTHQQLSMDTRSNGGRNSEREGGRDGVDGGRRCNAVVFWMEYQLSDKHRSTTGLTKVKNYIVHVYTCLKIQCSIVCVCVCVCVCGVVCACIDM